jgi:hypothetical protein
MVTFGGEFVQNTLGDPETAVFRDGFPQGLPGEGTQRIARTSSIFLLANKVMTVLKGRQKLPHHRRFEFVSSLHEARRSGGCLCGGHGRVMPRLPDKIANA